MGRLFLIRLSMINSIDRIFSSFISPYFRASSDNAHYHNYSLPFFIPLPPLPPHSSKTALKKTANFPHLIHAFRWQAASYPPYSPL